MHFRARPVLAHALPQVESAPDLRLWSPTMPVWRLTSSSSAATWTGSALALLGLLACDPTLAQPQSPAWVPEIFRDADLPLGERLIRADADRPRLPGRAGRARALDADDLGGDRRQRLLAARVHVAVLPLAGARREGGEQHQRGANDRHGRSLPRSGAAWRRRAPGASGCHVTPTAPGPRPAGSARRPAAAARRRWSARCGSCRARPGSGRAARGG